MTAISNWSAKPSFPTRSKPTEFSPAGVPLPSPILITGGTGFVGKHLVRLLKARGIEVVVLSSSPASQSDADVTHYQVDVRDRERIRSVIREINPQHIYHLAGISSVRAAWENPQLTYEINFLGTRHVFDAAMGLASPPRILNVSTAQVYGRSALPFTEETLVEPGNPYAASKAMAELLRIEYKNRGEGGVITVRPFNHTGAGQTEEFVLPAIAKQFAEIEAGLRPARLSMGNLYVKRDFTDVRDVAQAYAKVLDKGIAGEIYNVCSGSSVRLSEIIKMFEAASKLNVEVAADEQKMRVDDADEIRGDAKKIQSATGWIPQISIEETITELLDYWRKRTVGKAAN